MTELKESTWFIAMIILVAIFVSIVIFVAAHIGMYFPQCRFGGGRMLQCIYNVIYTAITGG